MSRFSRREILKMAAAGAASIPLERSGLANLSSRPQQILVPAEKGLTKEWLASLTDRGNPKIYKGDALKRIGMPIGGIGCGQVYLGGDGRLWHWDIFNQFGEGDMGDIRNGLHYKEPMKAESPFDMGFYISIGGRALALDLAQWPDCTFEGRYPMAKIDYGTQYGARVRLEAFSPFVPLNAADSGHPCAVMTFEVTNTTQQPMLAEMVGWLDNPCCLKSRDRRPVELESEYQHGKDWGFVQQSALELKDEASTRPDVVFADFESETYGEWKSEGTAFGSGPVEIDKIPSYQGDVKGQGKRVVNSHQTRNGEDIGKADAHVGKLTSPSFKIDRRYVTFLVGGASHAGKTCINLVVGGKPVKTATGNSNNAMSPATWDVRELQGQTAFIEIVDQISGAWGNIGVDHIVFTDRVERAPLLDENDFGTIGIGAIGPEVSGSGQTDSWAEFRKTLKAERPQAISSRNVIPPGQTKRFEFVVTWHFPNVNQAGMANLQRHDLFKRHYATRFRDAREVFTSLLDRKIALETNTKLWTNAWYDSTLPYWFLDRTMANTSILSTSTCYRFDDGRFYGWEGIYCCPGTCTHVWQYAHSVGRLFPELERDTRERVDYGIGYHEDGRLGHRAEVWQDAATDGQCGTILRVYREHQMTADDKWLRKMWPKVKRSIEFLIAQDPNRDGVLEGAQFNTLDATWYGKIAWISSLYVATLRAGEAMASSLDDREFAELCRDIAEKGSDHISNELFNGEYFIQRPDPNFAKAINTNDGCHIDQVFGQSWAHQVGLPRVLPADKCRQALKSLYRYNFAPDCGAYREKSKIRGGRWYALPGESGLLMCTWPKGGIEKAPGEGNENWAVGYFNECMTGFEHQVASHMIAEGLVQEGLTIEKAIDDRYDASRRNPYNEIECSDHYARAMASFGVYLAACGYQYHGPNQSLAFAPKIHPEKFKCAFTAAEGWGSYEQRVEGDTMRLTISMKFGKLTLKKFGFQLPEGWTAGAISSGEKTLNAKIEGELTWIDVAEVGEIGSGKSMQVKIQKAKPATG